MTWGTVTSTPARFGGGQVGSTNRELFLDVFGGEIITAFDLATIALDKHTVKTLKGARSWRFPKTWKASAEYHQIGKEMLGTDIDTSEITLTVDDILVAHTALADIDQMLSHFDVRSEYSKQLGLALARVFDKNVFRQIALAARTAADGPFPGGNTITDAALAADAVTGKYDGKDWIDAIRSMNLKLYNKDVPEEQTRYMAVNADIFDAIKFAKDSNGQFLVLYRELDNAGVNSGGLAGRAEKMVIDGVEIYRTRNLPSANESADTSVYSKYRADYSKTEALFWTPMAVATVKIQDIAFETERDVRRLEDFMVAKMLVGHGTLRPECAGEFKSA